MQERYTRQIAVDNDTNKGIFARIIISFWKSIPLSVKRRCSPKRGNERHRTPKGVIPMHMGDGFLGTLPFMSVRNG